MEKKINIAELLKDCPSGMELNCISYDNVSFDKISSDKKDPYPIFCYITDEKGNRSSISFTEDGCESKRYGAKCVIFPKGKNTWEKFIPPCKFKDGDIIIKRDFIAILSFIEPGGRIWYHCWYNTKAKGCKIKTDFGIGCINDGDEIRFATEEERQKLFDTLKSSGYKWNAETKTLEKLVKPKFKIGDIVRSKNCPTAGNFVIVGVEKDNYSINLENYCIKFKDQDNYELINKPKFKVGDRVKPTYNTNQYIIKGITTTHYTLEEVKHKFKYTEPIINDKDWELVPNKFDVNTLKTFDQVLVRLTNDCVWMPKFFYHYDTDSKMKYYPFVTHPFITIDNIRYPQCIPYKGNEYLCRTTNNCDEFYRVWEE